MVGVQHQRVARLKRERVFVLLLREHIIRRAELLDRGIVQTGTFLHLGSDEEPLALDLRHLRLDIPAAAHGQGVGRDVAAVQPQHTGHRIPESALSVPAISVLTDKAVAVTGPDFALRADAASMSLLLHPDAGCLTVVGVADFLADRDFLTGGAVVDKGLLLIVVLCHKIFSFRR